MRRARGIVLVGAVAAVSALAGSARAEPLVNIPDDVRGEVADEIYTQAEKAYEAGDPALGCQLAWEAAGYSAGDSTIKAEELVGECERDHGFVPFEGIRNVEVVKHPTEDLLDPYAETGGAAPASAPTDWPFGVSTQLLVFGASYGAYSGSALGVGLGLRGNAAWLGLAGSGAFTTAAYLVDRRLQLNQGQVSALMAGATWGSVESLLLTHAISDIGEPNTVDPSSYMTASFVTGLVGLGAGAAVAAWSHPDPDTIGFANSLGLYGGLGGLMLGGLMQPARDGGYSLNAFLGSTIGFASGLLFAQQAQLGRQRMAWVDLGVSVGALPGLIALAASDGDTERAVSVVSLGLMVGGGYLGWQLGKSDKAPAPAGATSLLWRGSDGRWGLGLPLPQGTHAPLTGTQWTVPVAAGQF